MLSLLTFRIAVKDKAHPARKGSSPSSGGPLFPAEEFLLNCPREYAAQIDPQHSMNRGFRLRQHEIAYRYSRTCSEQEIAISKTACYVYSRDFRDDQSMWSIEQVNDLWPPTTSTLLQMERWSWADESSISITGESEETNRSLVHNHFALQVDPGSILE
jgi:hypothetical protein